MKTSGFHFVLPECLIAQSPLDRRDSSRLLVLDRKSGKLTHRSFCELPELLVPGDLLVLNDSRVFPARLWGKKTGGAGTEFEFLLLEQKGRDIWETMVRPGRRAMPGSRFSFGGGALECEVLEVLEGGNRLAKFSYDGQFFDILDQIGMTPLPPYITKKLVDPERYQTVYASELGSAAAPTAGLHFTPELLAELESSGIGTATLTLHVGPGTFRPVSAENIKDHHMHSEFYRIPQKAAEKINRAKKSGGRVIAVGTTSCRTLESAARGLGGIAPCERRTDIFIYPGFQFKAIDGLITNFHLPESTLIMLVCAFAGYENTMAAYKAAVEEGYRFFSFGDAMLIV
ncbi:MAG: tRNA preQ1(34) S-adenosylmethionine ribosyltransferase-isomerase QueA [Oscillospiraceae bacterium]|nr:tRNA preQ1(34) S-adenosylmethionine ribosyltransferase-isomerase QueA [Oscillospiraceae bacterium]